MSTNRHVFPKSHGGLLAKPHEANTANQTFPLTGVN